MRIAPKISKKAKIKAGIKYLTARLEDRLIAPLKAKRIGWWYKPMGPDYYDAKTVVEQTRKRMKSHVKEVKRQTVQTIKEGRENISQLADLKAKAGKRGKQAPEAAKARVDELYKESLSNLKELTEIKQGLTAYDLGLSDKETRKRVFRMKKFKKTKQRH